MEKAERKWKFNMPNTEQIDEAENALSAYQGSRLGDFMGVMVLAVAALKERLAAGPSVTIDVRGIPQLQEELTRLKTRIEAAEMELKCSKEREGNYLQRIGDLDHYQHLTEAAEKDRDEARARVVELENQAKELREEPVHAGYRFNSSGETWEMCLPRKVGP